MIIVVIDETTLKLTFTESELQHPLFSSTLNKMYHNEDYDAHKHDDTVTVDLPTETTYTVIGQSVDEIRELWCGDVTCEYDSEGNQLPKDLSKCPCFTIGDMDVVEPVDPN